MAIYYIYALMGVVFTALGQLLYKQYFNRKQKIFLGLAILFFISVPYWNYKALTRLSIDLVYMLASLTILIVVTFSIGLFGEKVSKQQWLAAALIILGIILYNI